MHLKSFFLGWIFMWAMGVAILGWIAIMVKFTPKWVYEHSPDVIFGIIMGGVLLLLIMSAVLRIILENSP